MSVVEAKQELMMGSGLTTLPWVVDLVHTVSSAASFTIAVTGAIIGLHGVWRIIRLRWPRR